jgi:phage terminase large subunit-like protein
MPDPSPSTSIVEVRKQYASWQASVEKLPLSDQIKLQRHQIRTDLYYLLRYVMGRADIEHPWMLKRVREIQNDPDGRVDLWARDHRKSTCITYALTIQDILASHGDDPLPKWGGMEPTFGIFSHTRGIASEFVRQIKTELQSNVILIGLFPDVLYDNAERDAPRWSVQNGLTVKRKSNPKEATVEGWGLVDGQPTGKHFNVLIYDDVVVPESVSTPEMIEKTTKAWELSQNLGDRNPRMRGIGTRYHFADTWRAIIDRGALNPRIHPATDDGTPAGRPVFLTPGELAKKRQNMGPYTFSAQMLLNPIAESRQTFQRAWFDKRFDYGALDHKAMNRALICDPASEKKKRSDWTTMCVIGLGPDDNVYLLDFLRDRLTLKERGSEYLRLHKKWKPQYAAYEEYGLQADIEYIKILQEQKTYHFEITKVAGRLSKPDRINRLIPVCADDRFYMPEAIMRTTYEHKLEEQIVVLLEQEFLAWPVPVHDDGMDVISRYFDIPGFEHPEPVEEDHIDDRYNKPKRRAGSWMSR